MREPSARSKRLLRRATRRMGYDLVPFQHGFRALQKRTLAGVDLVVDVGANVGQYGSLLRSLGYGGQILSFEPQSSAFEELARVSARDAEWEVRPIGLSDSVGTALLQVSANSVSSSLLEVRPVHSLAAPGARVTSRESVAISTLDDELSARADARRIWLKLDVQGLEQQVLNGARALLSNCCAVQIEMSFDDLYEGQEHWLSLSGFLESQGFVLRHLESGFEDPATGHLQQADFLFLRP